MNSVCTFESLLRDPSLYEEAFSLLHDRSHKFCENAELKCKSDVPLTVTVDAYKKVMAEILAAEPDPQDVGYHLKLTRVPEDSFNDREYIDVSLVDDSDSTSYATSFQNWGSLREMAVDVDGLSISRSQILAELLWDCTFWGSTQEEVWDERDKLKNAMDEVTRGNCISFDSFAELEKDINSQSK